MMDVKDAHKVNDNLRKRPFICHENYIELGNGYVIAKEEYFKELQEKAEKNSE